MHEWLGSISTLVVFFFIFICIYIVYGWEVCFILSFFVKNSFSILQLFSLSILKSFISKYRCYCCIMQYKNESFFSMAFLFPPSHFVPYWHHFLFFSSKSSFLFSLLHHLATSSQPYCCFGHPFVVQLCCTKDKCMLWFYLFILLSCFICFAWNNTFSFSSSWWIVWRSKRIIWYWVLSKVHMTTTWQFSRHLKHMLLDMHASRFLSMLWVLKWFLSFEENGRSRTLLDKLKKHTCTKNSITFNNNNGCC